MYVTSTRTVALVLTSACESHMLKNQLIDSWCLACSDASVPGTYWYLHSRQVLHAQTTQIVVTLQAMYISAVLHTSIGITILQKALC